MKIIAIIKISRNFKMKPSKTPNAPYSNRYVSCKRPPRQYQRYLKIKAVICIKYVGTEVLQHKFQEELFNFKYFINKYSEQYK